MIIILVQPQIVKIPATEPISKSGITPFERQATPRPQAVQLLFSKDLAGSIELNWLSIMFLLVYVKNYSLFSFLKTAAMINTKAKAPDNAADLISSCRYWNTPTPAHKSPMITVITFRFIIQISLFNFILLGIDII